MFVAVLGDDCVVAMTGETTRVSVQEVCAMRDRARVEGGGRGDKRNRGRGRGCEFGVLGSAANTDEHK